MEKMFCFQCEQTAKGSGCDVSGVCGKKPETSNLQDKLISKVMSLAVSTKNTDDDEVDKIIVDALFVTITNVSFDDNQINTWCDKVDNVRKKYDNVEEKEMTLLWEENEDIRSLKSLILFGIKGICAYYHHARMLSFEDKEITNFFKKALDAIYNLDDTDELLKIALETGDINLKCMELLDKANTKTYGNPTPAIVPMTVEKGPFIVISGHDLHDLYLLLEQTKDTGVNVYTHGEMLPAHGYPKLKEYKNLKGNFGTAWQNQQKEFLDIPAPVLFTTNCIMPVKDNYKDRIFTTSVVAYPDMVHIDENKDFSKVIEKAIQLGGYKEDTTFTGINGGDKLLTGFGHDAVSKHYDTIIDAVKNKDIKHIFLIGGCDGAKMSRNYYTDLVKQTPDDTIILTLACGKFRFNDLDLGEIRGIPRILDLGQCNDAYSAIKIAVSLSEAFGVGVNELPLSIILSWYEQKAVSILLTLLSLGIENIKIGPSLPAFISENVLNILIQNYKLAPISTVEQDLAEILS